MPATTLTEADFQAQVVELAGILGWRTMHVRRSIGKGHRWQTTTSLAGYPDLTLWHPTQRRVIFAELKSDKGQPSPEQVDVLRSLCEAGAEVHLWRPGDWDRLQAVLSGSRRVS